MNTKENTLLRNIQILSFMRLQKKKITTEDTLLGIQDDSFLWYNYCNADDYSVTAFLREKVHMNMFLH